MNGLESTLEKVGRVMVDQYGIRVVCRGNRCCTDGKTVYLPALPDDIPKPLFEAIRGYCDHEVGHLRARSNFAVGAAFRKQYGDAAFGVLNCLEDLRVEAFMKAVYPGSATNLANAFRYAEAEVKKQVAAGEPASWMRQFAFAVAARGSRLPVPDFVSSEVVDVVARVTREIDQALVAKNTREVAVLAESVWAVVKSYLASSPSSSRSGAGADAKGEAKKADGKSRRRKGGTRSGKGDPSASDEEKGPGRQVPSSDSSGEPPDTADSQDGTSQDRVGTSANGGDAVAGRGGATDADVMAGVGAQLARDVAAHAVSTGGYRVWSTQHDRVVTVENDAAGSHSARMAPLMRHVGGVRQKLVQSLQAESRRRWLPDQEDGALNPRALHRLAAARHCPTTGTSEEMGGALTRRIFRRRVVTRRLETAVSLLIDLSHSMSGKKLMLARETALVLCEALARLMIPVAVTGFSTRMDRDNLKEAVRESGMSREELERSYRFAPLIHERYKLFDEPFRSISGRFDAMHTHMLTPLGESMLFAARELAARREPRQILLVLTDGRPTVGLDNDLSTFNHAHESIRRIERAGIDVLLIGILERCVLDLHPRSVVVEQLDQLPTTVMTQLRQHLTRHTPTHSRSGVGAPR